MAADWIKNIKGITWVRVWAAILLLALASGFFTDWDDNALAFKFIVPFTYLYTWGNTSIRDVSVLIVPLLINIALWIPCYRSYVFLKVVLYVEYCKFLLMMPFLLLMLPFSVLFQRNNPAPIFFITVILFFIVKELISKLKKEEYVQYFKADNKSKLEQERALRIMIFTLAFIVVAGHVIDMHITRNKLVVYTPVKTYELQHPQLKYIAANSKVDNPYIYNDKPIASIADKAKLSLDGKSLLVRISTQDDKGKDLFVFDTDKFTNTRILQTPKIEKGSRTTSGYAFTNDGKYVVVGDEPSKGSKIKFQVIDIATGKRDDRFSDIKGISKLHLSKGVQGVETIEFSPSGKYFAVIIKPANIIEVWDYEKKELAYTEFITDKIVDFEWLTDEKLLIIHEFYRRKIGNVGLVLECDLNNGRILKKVRYDISESLMVYLYNTSVYMKSGVNGKNIALYVSKGTTFQGNNLVDRLSIWNVESDKKLFEIDTVDEIKGLEFYPDGGKVLIFTMLYDGTGKITIWNIVTSKKEKEIHIQKLYNNIDKRTPFKIKLMENGKRLMIIVKDIHFLSLE